MKYYKTTTLNLYKSRAIKTSKIWSLTHGCHPYGLMTSVDLVQALPQLLCVPVALIPSWFY